MADGPNVGNAHVTVGPDTSGFQRDLDAQLAAVRAGIDANVRADTTGVREKIKTDLDGITADIKTNVDAATLRERVRTAVLGAAADVPVGTDLRANDLAAKVKLAADAAAARVRVDADTSRLDSVLKDSAVRGQVNFENMWRGFLNDQKRVGQDVSSEFDRQWRSFVDGGGRATQETYNRFRTDFAQRVIQDASSIGNDSGRNFGDNFLRAATTSINGGGGNNGTGIGSLLSGALPGGRKAADPAFLTSLGATAGIPLLAGAAFPVVGAATAALPAAAGIAATLPFLKDAFSEVTKASSAMETQTTKYNEAASLNATAFGKQGGGAEALQAALTKATGSTTAASNAANSHQAALNSLSAAQTRLAQVQGGSAPSANALASAQTAVANAQIRVNSTTDGTAAHAVAVNNLNLAQTKLDNIQKGSAPSASALASAQASVANAQLRVNSTSNSLTAAQDKLSASNKQLGADQVDIVNLLSQQDVTWATLTNTQRTSAIQLRENSAEYKGLSQSQKDALNALLAEKAAYDALTPSQQTALTGYQDLKKAFDDLRNEAAPGIFTAIGTAEQAIANAMKPLLPLIDATTGSFVKLFQQLDGAVNSPGYTKFIDAMTKGVDQSITGFGAAIGNITTGLGKMFEVLIQSGLGKDFLDWLDQVTKKFTDWAGSNKGRDDILHFVDEIKTSWPAAKAVVDDLAKIIDDLWHAFAGDPLALQGIHVILDTIGWFGGTAAGQAALQVGAYVLLFQRLATALSATAAAAATLGARGLATLGAAGGAISGGAATAAAAPAAAGAAGAAGAQAGAATVAGSTADYAAAGASAATVFRTAFTTTLKGAAVGTGIAVFGNQLVGNTHGAAGDWGKLGADAAGGFVAGFTAAGPAGGVAGAVTGAIVGVAKSPTIQTQLKNLWTNSTQGLGAALQASVTGKLPAIKSQTDHLWDNQPKAIDYNINNPIKSAANAAKQQLIQDTVSEYSKFPGAINYNIAAPTEKVALAARQQLIDDTAKAYDKFPGAIDYNIRDPLAANALAARDAFIQHLSEAFGVSPGLIKTNIENPNTAAAQAMLADFQLRSSHLYDNAPAALNTSVLAPGVGAAAQIQSIFSATSQHMYDNVPGNTQLMVLAPGNNAATQIKSVFDVTAQQMFNNAPNAIKTNVVDPSNQFFQGQLPGTISNGMASGFGSAANNVVNPFLASAKNAVSGLGAANIPLVIAAQQLAPNQPFGAATGGLLDGVGTGTSDSNIIRVSKGEFVVNAAATANTLPLLMAINSGAYKGFKDGGEARGYATGGLIDNGQAAPTWEKYFNASVAPGIQNLQANYATVGGLSGAAVNADNKVIDDWLKKKDAAYLAAIAAAFAAGGGSAATSAQVAAWISAAMQAAGVSGAAWASGLATIIARESGGNPNAINLTDSNAAAGTPSQGLAQVIPPTFAAYHVAGTSDNILDPVANIAAAIRYIIATYGDISKVQQANPNLPPAGYDTGGMWPTGTTGINTSGASEGVLTAAGVRRVGGPAAIHALNHGGGSGTVAQLHLHVDLDGQPFENMVYQVVQNENEHMWRALESGMGVGG